MTIASQTSRISYTGDGSTSTFAIPFFFLLNSDLVVSLQDLTGVATNQTIGTNYTLTGANVGAGGTCTFVVAPALGFIVTIYRDPALTQTTSYNNNDPFPAKSHEAALDKACTIDQRTRDIVTRSLRLPDNEAATTTMLPSIPNRKNRMLAFDSSGGVVAAIGPNFVSSTAVGVAVVDSRATAQVTVFTFSVNVVSTRGGNAPGDGFGQDYIRGTSLSPTPFQDGGGVYWTPAVVQSGVQYASLLGVPALIAAPTSIWSTGDVKLTLKTAADPLWLLFDDGTFGNAGSGASNRANVDTQALFTLLYSAPFTDANCPLLTSAGASTTRGAIGSAATAFNTPNFCRMTLPKTLGRALAIAGSGSGLTARTLGAALGAETATLATTNLPAIPYTPAGTITNGAITSITNNISSGTGGGTLNLSVGGFSSSGTFTSGASGFSATQATSTFSGTTAALGGSATPVSIVQPTSFLNAMVKL